MPPAKSKSIGGGSDVAGGKAASAPAPVAAAASSSDFTTPGGAPPNKNMNTHSTPFLDSIGDVNRLRYVPQPVAATSFDFDRLVIGFPIREDKGTKGSSYRPSFRYVHPDNTISPVIVTFGTPKEPKYCYGVQANNVDLNGLVKKDKDTGEDFKLTAYRVPIVMESRDGATERETQEVAFLDGFVECIGNWAAKNKKMIGLGAKSDVFIREMVKNIIYRKKDKETGELIEGAKPMFYCDLDWFSKDNNFKTKFYGRGGKEYHPLDPALAGHFRGILNVRIPDMFINAKNISAKTLMYDGSVDPVVREPPKRMAPAADEIVGGSHQDPMDVDDDHEPDTDAPMMDDRE